MNFVVDESVDRHIVDQLRKDGHSIYYIAEMDSSISDDEVLKTACRESCPLITADKDFGELIFHKHLNSNGIVLIRLSGLSAVRKARIVSSAISNHGSRIPGNFSVITPAVIRIRKMGQ